MSLEVAEIVQLGNEIEEEVLINVNGEEILCFASYCPIDIEVGKKYKCLFSADDYTVIKIDEALFTVNKNEHSYGYKLTGTLKNGILNGLFRIADEYLESEYSYLNGCNVLMNVVRLDVEFIEQL